MLLIKATLGSSLFPLSGLSTPSKSLSGNPKKFGSNSFDFFVFFKFPYPTVSLLL